MISDELLRVQAMMLPLLNVKHELEEELKIAATAWPEGDPRGEQFMRGLKRALFHVRVELGETTQEI